MVEVTARPAATEIDVDGLVDEAHNIRYLGKATRGFDGRWRCLADVGGALCLVEVTVRPIVHIDVDPGDEDDRTARDVRRDRDLAP
jgi:hypothetical protein